MLNQVVLVGRVKKINKNEFDLEVPRPYKNEEGEYEKDSINVQHNMQNIEMINQIKENDLIGVKGCIQNNNKIIAEKITFLSSKTNEIK